MKKQHAELLIDQQLAYVVSLMGHITHRTNPTMVYEAMSAFHLEQLVDPVIQKIRAECSHADNIFHEEVRKGWGAYSRDSGGAVPHDSVCDYTLIKRREIYLIALKKSLT